MELDNVVKNAIKEACEGEDAAVCASPITKLIERFSSNQIQTSQLNSSLRDIYTLMKGEC
jgi:hypothetical protein